MVNKLSKEMHKIVIHPLLFQYYDLINSQYLLLAGEYNGYKVKCVCKL